MEASPPLSSSSASRRTLLAWLAAATAVAVAMVLWSAFKVAGERGTQIFTDVVTTLAPVAAAVACFRTGRRLTTGRAAWTLIGAGVGAWGLGEIAWSIYEIPLHRSVPFPSVADVGYLAFIPLAVAGILLLPSIPRRLSGRLRVLSDAIVVLGGLFVVSWVIILRPLYRATAETLLAKYIGLAYPMGDIVIIAVVVYAIVRIKQDRLPFVLVSLGALSLACADSGFSYLTTHGSYQTGGFIDFAWPFGFMLIGCGAVALRDSPFVPPAEDALPSTAEALAPYVLIAPALSVYIYQTVRHTLSPVLIWNGVAVFLAVALRQFVALHDQTKLARSLDKKVRDRTSELAESEERSRAIIDTANDAFVSVDRYGRILEWNRRAEQMFGWQREEALGRRVVDTIVAASHRDPESDPFGRLIGKVERRTHGKPVEVIGQHRDGSEFLAELTAWKSGVGARTTFNAFVRDISERRAFEQKLTHQALHDSLTGLANRALFEERVAQALQRARDGAGMVGLLFIDLDDFKNVNDSLGHTPGDKLLVAVAELLKSVVRPTDTVARFGGDEFAICLEHAWDELEIQRSAERILRAFEQWFRVGEREIQMRASIGIATSTGAITVNELIRNADAAMYAAKSAGKARARLFEPRMHAAILERLELEAALRRAVLEGRMSLAYQPVVDIGTGVVYGFEALVRWPDEERGILQPEDFIPLAEESGLIIQLGEWVLDQACRVGASWQRRFDATLTYAVNLSVKQFQDPDLIAKVERAISRHDLRPGSLVLELTEGLLAENTAEFTAKLRELRALGVRIAIDDFGTGYSSLGYLQRLPIDVLKIDKSFVEGIDRGPQESALARAIIKVADTMNLHIVAEGVEREPQRAELMRLGCRFAQGFLFSAPLDESAVEIMLLSGVGNPGERRLTLSD